MMNAQGFSRPAATRVTCLLFLLSVTLLAQPGSAQTVHPEIWPQTMPALAADPELEQAVETLLARLSVAEKVGQVLQVERGHVSPADIRTYHLGSVLSGGGSHPSSGNDPNDWLALADAYWDASMDVSDGGQAIPIIWGVDAVHGHNNVRGATVFPHNIALGATRNPALIRRIGEITAIEVAVTGLDWTFGPCVAVARSDRWGRTYEAYSEDPEIHRLLAGEMVSGLQGDAGSEGFFAPGAIIATAKHFIGDGGTIGGYDQGDNRESEEDLRDIHGAGYVAAVEAGVQTVMASFSSWHGRKMHGFEELLTDVLKERMGFDGFVVGDWNGHGQVQGCSNRSCAVAFNAGVDMFMVPYRSDWMALYNNLLGQVGSGEISTARLDDAVRRILRVKMRARLFDRGRPSERPLAGDLQQFGSAAHRAVARQAVRESLVLLKNHNQILPLSRQQRVLVAGDGANSIPKQCGGWTYTWQGTGTSNADFPGATSIWQGIRQVVEAGGGYAELSEDGSFAVIPDVAVVVFGEDPYAEGSGDRRDLDYSASSPDDLALLQSLQAVGVPVVSIFLSGRPLWTTPEIDASDAFVAAWLPGTEGDGIAEVIFRDSTESIANSFTGRLAFSWPRAPGQSRVNRGDEEYDPLFPYGYGLRYSSPGLDQSGVRRGARRAQ
jgi:beta-glucosidase